VPGFLEPVYTADAIYWQNPHLAMASGKSLRRSGCTTWIPLAVGKLEGLEARRVLIEGNSQQNTNRVPS